MSDRPDGHWLTAHPFAHRGLHGAGRSENGMAAFEAAIAAGYGIECDVRLSRDRVPFVFHDRDLVRMTGRPERIDMLNAATLDGVRLPDGGAIPRLSALLTLCGGAVPLLVEIKAKGRDAGPLCRAVAQEMARGNANRVAVMSFDPRVARCWARQRCGQLRGLVVTEQGKSHWRGRIERALALWRAKPDFLACDIRDLPSTLSVRARAMGIPVLSWTVRTRDDRARAAACADQIIFERADG